MASEIHELDTGLCAFQTWHNQPQYKILGRAVTYAEAQETFGYPQELRPCFGYVSGELVELEGSHFIVRTDHEKILSLNHGNRYALFDMASFLSHVKTEVLDVYEDIQIESVGTLKNGAGQFISLLVYQGEIKGDESRTLYRLIFSHIYGETGLRVRASKVRVQCANTEALSWTWGKDRTKVCHTSSGIEIVKKAMENIASLYTACTTNTELQNYLAGTEFTTADVNAMLDKIFPVVDGKGEPKEGRGLSIVNNKRDKVKMLYRSGQAGMNLDVSQSAYGFLNAVTQYYRDENGRNKSNVAWDNVAGTRSVKKQEAFEQIKEYALAK